MDRALTSPEIALWLIDRGAPQNFVMVTHIEGKLPSAIVREALLNIQQRHPPLRCKFKENSLPSFVSQNVPEIPFQVLVRTQNTDWIHMSESEMRKPFPWFQGPLVRVIMLEAENGCDLLITLCHVVADATSGVIIVKNILRIAEQLMQGNHSNLPEPALPPRPFSLDLLKKDLTFSPKKEIHLKDLGNKPVKLQCESSAPLENRITKVIHTSLSPYEADALLSKCRKTKVSAHAVLSGALLQSIARQIRLQQGSSDVEALNIGVTTPRNIRQLFSVSIDEEVGDWISDAFHYQLISEHSSLTEAAVAVKNALQYEIDRGNDIQALYGIGDLLKKASTPREILRAVDEDLPPVVITNLGRLDIGEQFGELKVQNLHFVVSINPVAPGGIGLSATSHAGFITLNFLYLEPCIKRKIAQTIADDSINRLKFFSGK